MTDMPFTILVLFMGFASFIGVIGIILGFKKIGGAPMFPVFAGILIFVLVVETQTIDVGYSDAQPSNTTQTGGIVSCSTTTNTTCTTTAIVKTFTYFNSTGQQTNQPDPIPQKYQFNQNNVWVYMILLGAFWIIIGVMIQFRDW